MERDLRTLLIKHGFTFKKAYGQNFLTDENLLSEIVDGAKISDKDTVLEIGCGAGALTRVLCGRANRVVGYEIDQKLKPVLEETLEEYDNVKVIFKDIMKEDFSALEESLKKDYVMVANLPYYITTPIILRFIENSKNIKSMIVMVQEEVAKRLCAKEGTADYGAITVAINLRGNAEIIKRVPREKFTPSPNVDSAVVKIDFDREKNKGVDFNKVREAVKVGFGNRRKMLVNNLMNTYKLSRADAESILTESGISLTARGETLSYKDYIILSENIK